MLTVSYWARLCALGTLAAVGSLAATYQASVQVSLTLPDPVAGVLDRTGREGTAIADFFDPLVLAGDARFDAFAGFASFRSGVLDVRLGGPSGFANPGGISVAGGGLGTEPVLLSNLTSGELPVTLLLGYSYSLSASANDGETASASVEFDVFREPAGSVGAPATLFHFARSILPDNAEDATDSTILSLTLPPESVTTFFLSAETKGQAIAIPEPGTALTGGLALCLWLYRVRRSRSWPKNRTT